MEGVISSFDIVKGLPMARWKVVTKYEDLKMFGFPCYLKADISGHKTDVGAVVRCDNLKDAEEALKAGVIYDSKKMKKTRHVLINLDGSQEAIRLVDQLDKLE